MASGYSEARRQITGYQFDHPRVGFAVDMVEMESAQSEQHFKQPVVYEWPDVTIGRQVGRLGSNWTKFGKELVRRSSLVGEPVAISDMQTVYVAPESVSHMLTRRYPNVARNPNDRAREAVAESFVEQFNSAVSQRQQKQVNLEIGYLLGETYGLSERSRQARESDFVDYEPTEDEIMPFVPTVWANSEFVVHEIDTRGNFDMVLVLDDNAGIIESEKSAIPDILRYDLNMKAVPQLDDDEPTINILRTRTRIHDIARAIIPNAPYSLPLGPPQATIG